MADLFILAKGATWTDRYQVTSLAASAVAAGDSVDIALFFGALDAWVKDEWSRLDPEPPLEARAIEEATFPPLADLLDDARSTGRLRLFACSASGRLLKLDSAQVQGRVDAIMGWQSFAKMVVESGKTVTF